MSLEINAGLDNGAPRIHIEAGIKEVQRGLTNDCVLRTDRSVATQVSIMLDGVPPEASSAEVLRILNFAAFTAVRRGGNPIRTFSKT